LPPGLIEVLHNPVEEAPAAADERRDGSRVVFAGTLTANKGVLPLLEAWSRVVRERPDARLDLYGRDSLLDGGGSMRAELEARLEPSIQHSVRFLGLVPRSDLLRAYERARAAVFPSFAEAFALAPLEAMSRGCATVYTRRCSGPEVIEDGRDGLLVDPARPDEIADALLRLLASPSLADQLGDAGRRRVRKDFSVEASLRRNEEFYGGCVARFRGARRR
jgi:glycosyltransferase involved in cell wall biosynthesis